jgi:hypothetical protein
MELLRDLLELLAVADLWDLQELKVKAGWVIASEQKLVGPDTHELSTHFFPSSLVPTLTYIF